MSKLIALVATAVMVGGNRTIIGPGEELPDLSSHDAAELLRTGMAQDPAAAAAQDKADKQAEAKTQREFQQARERALAAQASTEPEPAAKKADKPTKAPAKEAPGQPTQPR